MENTKLPSFFKESNKETINLFYNWQIHNKYYGKQFSILGDSISTFHGYNPNNYKVFYSGNICEKSCVKKVSDTWWHKVINYFGGKLLVNNSWSGSRVTKLPNSDQLFPSACSDERTSSLHKDTLFPDVILVYLGTNDWAFGVKTGFETISLENNQQELFSFAYNTMLLKLKKNYPQSEIWCCTLSKTLISKQPDFIFPEKPSGIHIEKYNEIIRNITYQNHCKLINLYNYNIPYDSIDGSHPTNQGMDTLAAAVILSMTRMEDISFLGCTSYGQNLIFVI